jgi:hypothetical protein
MEGNVKAIYDALIGLAEEIKDGEILPESLEVKPGTEEMFDIYEGRKIIWPNRNYIYELKVKDIKPDDSMEADAKRFRWLLDGNKCLWEFVPENNRDKNKLRSLIDKDMREK